MIVNGTNFASLTVLLMFASFGIANACVGEVAGAINFNVSAGSSQTLQMQVFNSCTNQSVYFTTFAQVKPKINFTTPTATTSPKNGTLGPRENLYINITVFMPYNAVPGTSWSAGAAVEEATSAPASGGGASLNVGVVKLFGIAAKQAIFNPLPYALGASIAIAAIIAGAYYYIRTRKPSKAKPREKSEDKVSKRLRRLEAKYAAERARLLAQKKGKKPAAKKATRPKAKRSAKKAAKRKKSR